MDHETIKHTIEQHLNRPVSEVFFSNRNCVMFRTSVHGNTSSRISDMIAVNAVDDESGIMECITTLASLHRLQAERNLRYAMNQ